MKHLAWYYVNLKLSLWEVFLLVVAQDYME